MIYLDKHGREVDAALIRARLNQLNIEENHCVIMFGNLWKMPGFAYHWTDATLALKNELEYRAASKGE